MLIKVPPRWSVPESQVTPEAAYRARPRRLHAPTRREVLKYGSALGGAALAGCGQSIVGLDSGVAESPYDAWFPVDNNPAYTVPERPLTDESAATTYNNYYEFTTSKSAVWQTCQDFEIEPWTVEVDGLVRNGGTFGVEDLFALFDMEERIYRFRCVEAWAMTVPWSGFPLARLLEHVDPLSEATHVAFESAYDPAQMPGTDALAHYPWPYHEGLTLDEASNELVMMVGGLYGKAIPRQNGAPLRLIVPWKYGYKSAKAIVRITLTDSQPPTLWNTLVPSEYGFESNVDPDTPHPRWSQAEERLIADGEVVETLPYNGYEAEVAHLYG